MVEHLKFLLAERRTCWLFVQLAGSYRYHDESAREPCKLTDTWLCISELEMAKFDNTLVRALAKNAVKAMNMYNVKCEALVSHAPSDAGM